MCFKLINPFSFPLSSKQTDSWRGVCSLAGKKTHCHLFLLRWQKPNPWLSVLAGRPTEEEGEEKEGGEKEGAEREGVGKKGGGKEGGEQGEGTC